MWIYLLRHGIAEDLRPGLSDGDRTLTEEGRRRLRRAAAAWGKVVARPDVVVSSPLLRARETAELFAEAVGYDEELRIEEVVTPHGSTDQTIALLEGDLLAKTDSIAIVGHEPHLGYLLGALLTAHPRVSVPLKKGMLVALETESTTSLVTGMRFALTQKAAGKLG